MHTYLLPSKPFHARDKDMIAKQLGYSASLHYGQPKFQKLLHMNLPLPSSSIFKSPPSCTLCLTSAQANGPPPLLNTSSVFDGYFVELVQEDVVVIQLLDALSVGVGDWEWEGGGSELIRRKVAGGTELCIMRIKIWLNLCSVLIS